MILQKKDPINLKEFRFTALILNSLKLISYLLLFSLILFSATNSLLLKENFGTLIDKVTDRFISNPYYRISDLDDIPSYFIGMVKGIIQQEELVKMNLIIDHAHILKIINESESELSRNYYPAKISMDDIGESNKIKLKVRGKGDRKLHFEDINSMSFRANLKGQERIFGVEEFSIQKPIIRNYIWEYLIAEIYRSEGLMTVRSWPIDFQVNGDYRGIYTVEEVPSKNTIEQQKRKNGPIFGIDETISLTIDTKLDPYELKDWQDQPLFQEAKAILYEEFRKVINNNEFSSQNFDLDEWAKYFALSDIFGSYHGTVPKSVRFYFNPVIGKFQPILFDAHLGAGLWKDFILLDFHTKNGVAKCEWLCEQRSFYSGFFSNYAFLSSYLKYLKLYSSESFIKKIKNTYNEQFQKFNNEFYARLSPSDAINGRGFSLYLFKFDRLEDRQSLLRRRLSIYDDIQISRKSGNDISTSQNLIIPDGTQVIKYLDFQLLGSQLNITKPTIYLLSGETNIEGMSKDEPLIIKGSAMFVIESGNLNMKNVVFDSLQVIPIENRNLSGAVNIVSTPTYMKDITILNSNGEDAINIISSPFSIDNLTIKSSSSDAIDLDFSDGTISKLFCYNIGNDCLDLSESSLNLDFSEILNTQDKAISVGENSTLYIKDVSIANSAIGLVSKDGSSLDVDNVSLKSVKLPVAVFKKKPSYNNPSINISSIKSDQDIFGFFNYDAEISIPDSINKEYMSSEEIESLLYGVEYGKATVR